MEKAGLWLIGACGYVGSVTALGLSTLRRRGAPMQGLVTESSEFLASRLVGFRGIELGGHDVKPASESMLTTCAAFRGVVDPDVIKRARSDLRRWQTRIRCGTLLGSPRARTGSAHALPVPRDRSAAQAVERLAADIREFRRAAQVEHVVVVNLASSEPLSPIVRAATSWSRLEKQMARRGPSPLPTSSLYALAAIEADCAYVNFTPSRGIDLPALRQRADAKGLPYMGRDGKTGETLVKSVLAPLFVFRNLRVRAWVGYNMLGNPDGAALRDGRIRRSKQRSKDLTVPAILGYSPTTAVGIDFVPSLGDRKVAWDLVHFEGFLGTEMSMQFTWQGVDSLLAAPLVLDLARLAALELRLGTGGPMLHLACFFKDPMEVGEHALHEQWRQLVRHVTRAGSPARARAGRLRGD